MTYDRFVLIASPILFDTAGFEEWRIKDCRMQEQARKKRTVVA